MNAPDINLHIPVKNAIKTLLNGYVEAGKWHELKATQEQADAYTSRLDELLLIGKGMQSQRTLPQSLGAATLEAVVDRRYSLNDLFSFLSAQGISVVSMRNKANRLEELFVNMVRDGTRASGAGS